jgi:hypothetical protein
MEKKNNIWMVVLGAIVVILILFLLVRNMNKTAVVTPEVPASDTVTSAQTPSSTEDVSAGDINAQTPQAVISYNDALNLYAKTRIQFNNSCQVVVPNVTTFKNNTLLMLDNRSASTRTLHLGFMGNVTIKPWAFKIVMFSSSTLPRAVIVDCDHSQNVTTISLQK